MAGINKKKPTLGRAESKVNAKQTEKTSPVCPEGKLCEKR